MPLSPDEIIARLSDLYGMPHWVPHHDPVSELVLTVLSQNTSDTNSGRAFNRLRQHFDGTRQLPTFPSRAPVVGLDRVWVHPRGRLRGARVEASPAARVASDHLPLVATIDCR